MAVERLAAVFCQSIPGHRFALDEITPQVDAAGLFELAQLRAEGRRHGLHWLITGIAFLICWLPVMRGAPIEAAVGNFLLVAGLAYALAGVHLERPMLWSGLIMLAAYVMLNMFALPYTWTITGIAIGVALAWAGISVNRSRQPAAH